MSIETSIGKKAEAPEASIEDKGLFGELLKKLRGNVFLRVAAEQIGVNFSSLAGWELGTSLPDEKRILQIAKVYNSDPVELMRVFNISVLARKMEKDARRKPTFAKVKQEYL